MIRVLVTGGTGFLGQHVYELFNDEGYAVYQAGRQHGDLTRRIDTVELFGVAKPDVVIHLAGEVGGIGANQASPGRYWYANTLIGANVLETARVLEIEKLVMVGTVCAYPISPSIPFREEELWEGYPEPTNAPYGIAKRTLLVGAQAYREQYGLNSIYLLPTNLYGPGDNFNTHTSHVIPALIRKMRNAEINGYEEITLWGDGTPTRDFLYAKDCAQALLKATRFYNDPAPINLGTGNEVSMRALAELIAHKVGYEGDINWDASKPNGQPRRCLDVSKAKEKFDFSAETRLEDGIEKTIRWFDRSFQEMYR